MTVVVSLTAISGRLKTLPRVLGTILGQSRPPDAVRLWLSSTPFLFDRGVEERDLPHPVRQLADQGRIEIRFTPNIGPHRKLVPMLREVSEVQDPPLIVTADDDVLYPQRWLEALCAGHERNPDAIICFRARRIRYGQRGLRPYTEWPVVDRDDEVLGNDLVCTGVAGMLVHRDMFDARILGPEFEDVAPSRADAWMSGAYLSEGTPVSKLSMSRIFPDPSGIVPKRGELPNALLKRRRGVARWLRGGRKNSRREALWAHNRPHNDEIFRRTFAFYGLAPPDSGPSTAPVGD